MNDPPPAAAPDRRPAAWLLSLWCHAGVLAAMALAVWPTERSPRINTLAADFAAAEEAAVMLPKLAAAASGSPPPAPTPPAPAAAGDYEPADLGEGEPSSAAAQTDRPPSGSGDAAGAFGEGAGELPAFLDAEGLGDRLVYVVDCSKSMRKPFPSPERSRLGRVKRELMGSIAGLSDRQKFFVIFFNDQALPMPGGRYLAGGPGGAERVRPWIGRVGGGGQTDPEDALLMALSLRPDAVFFLTDGDFDKVTVDRVVASNARGTRVHAIGFGDDIRKRHPDSRRRTGPTLAEYLLADIARRTGGTVKFIATEPVQTAAK